MLKTQVRVKDSIVVEALLKILFDKEIAKLGKKLCGFLAAEF